MWKKLKEYVGNRKNKNKRLYRENYSAFPCILQYFIIYIKILIKIKGTGIL